MNNVAQFRRRCPSRQFSYSVVDEQTSLAEEIRRQVAWIALAARKIDQDADAAAGHHEIEEALAWLMTISLEVDEVEKAELRREVQPTSVDAAAEE